MKHKGQVIGRVITHQTRRPLARRPAVADDDDDEDSKDSDDSDQEENSDESADSDESDLQARVIAWNARNKRESLSATSNKRFLETGDSGSDRRPLAKKFKYGGATPESDDDSESSDDSEDDDSDSDERTTVSSRGRIRKANRFFTKDYI